MDSGATRSCISSKFLSRLRLTPSPLDANIPSEVFTADNSPMPVLGQIDLSLTINGLIVPHTFIVLPSLFNDCLLGVDFLLASHAKIDFNSRRVFFYDDVTSLPLTSLHSASSVIRIAQALTILPSCEAIIPVKLHRNFKPQLRIIEPFSNLGDKNLFLAKSLVHRCGHSSVCKVLNPTNAPIKLRSNFPLGTIEPINPFDTHNKRLLSLSTQPRPSHEFINSLSTEPELPQEMKIQKLTKLGLNLK